MDEIYTHYAHHAFYFSIIFMSFCRVTYFVPTISLKPNTVFYEIYFKIQRWYHRPQIRKTSLLFPTSSIFSQSIWVKLFDLDISNFFFVTSFVWSDRHKSVSIPKTSLFVLSLGQALMIRIYKYIFLFTRQLPVLFNDRYHPNLICFINKCNIPLWK